MSTQTHYFRRDPATVSPWAETCGQIRCLVEASDGTPAEIHQVEIEDAKLHYHAKTDEFYYIIAGAGTMILDDETIEIHQGLVVYVPRGVRHKAIAAPPSEKYPGKLTVLTICIPRGVLDDVHEVE